MSRQIKLYSTDATFSTKPLHEQERHWTHLREPVARTQIGERKHSSTHGRPGRARRRSHRRRARGTGTALCAGRAGTAFPCGTPRWVPPGGLPGQAARAPDEQRQNRTESGKTHLEVLAVGVPGVPLPVFPREPRTSTDSGKMVVSCTEPASTCTGQVAKNPTDTLPCASSTALPFPFLP